MITIVRFLVILVSLLASGEVYAQKERVHISNDDPRWGERIRVTYTAVAGSSWTKPNNANTLFCAAVIHGARPEHAIVVPMRHISDSAYEAALTVPDSTSSLWVEICTPTDRVPDGISVFTCRTADGKPTPRALFAITTNYDSALTANMVLYPKDYSAYIATYYRADELSQGGQIELSDSARAALLVSLTDRLLKAHDNTAAWHLTLYSLYKRRGRDSLATTELMKASKTTQFDPIFNEADYWKYFFAPTMKKRQPMIMPYEAGVAIAPLVERNPRSRMAFDWIRLMAYDTQLPASTFRKVVAAWSSSKDVDLLESVAHAYGYDKSLSYDPAVALQWLSKAEESSRTGAGFYSGENIYGSMGRLQSILDFKVTLLALTGKLDEAVRLAQSVMSQANEQYEKQRIAVTLGKVYLDAGRIEDAKRQFGIALSLSTHATIPGLDKLYDKAKEGDETLVQFSRRITAAYGGKVEMPAIPDFAFKTLDGLSSSLLGLRGKVVVIDCWFTTCAGCVVEKNSLNKLVDSYAGDTNVVFLSIALDDAGTLKRYLEHSESKFKIVPDGQEICTKIGVSGYPTHIIIGRDGKTLGCELGGSMDEGEMMRPKIEQALAGKI